MYFDHILCPPQLLLGFPTSLPTQIYDLLPLYLSKKLKKNSKQIKSKRENTKTNKKRSKQQNMDSILLWPTTHWHGTCPGISLIHLVTFH